MTPPFEFLTTSQLAAKLKISPSLLRYYARSRGIVPAARIGPIWVFGPDSLIRLQEILAQQECRRLQLHPAPIQEVQNV